MPSRLLEPAPLEERLEPHRRALTGYCYRMLGSGLEAEDAVQETMVRAWRAQEDLREEAALRSWLFRIAGNVCLDMIRGPQRRALPMDLGPAQGADAPLGAGLPPERWIGPIADGSVLEDAADPARIAEARETLRLAFVAALQHLPARQRAVLILRESLRWSAQEVAELLGTTVASVNSALQRARATLHELGLQSGGGTPTSRGSAGAVTTAVAAGEPMGLDAASQSLLDRYVDAFERYDIRSLVLLVHEDATFTMPPFPLWVQGPREIERFMLGTGRGCEGSRLLTVRANGCPAAAIYHRDGDGGGYHPWALVLLETEDGQITGLHHFLYPELFPRFGLPERLDADGRPEVGLPAAAV